MKTRFSSTQIEEKKHYKSRARIRNIYTFLRKNYNFENPDLPESDKDLFIKCEAMEWGSLDKL